MSSTAGFLSLPPVPRLYASAMKSLGGVRWKFKWYDTGLQKKRNKQHFSNGRITSGIHSTPYIHMFSCANDTDQFPKHIIEREVLQWTHTLPFSHVDQIQSEFLLSKIEFFFFSFINFLMTTCINQHFCRACIHCWYSLTVDINYFYSQPHLAWMYKMTTLFKFQF